GWWEKFEPPSDFAPEAQLALRLNRKRLRTTQKDPTAEVVVFELPGSGPPPESAQRFVQEWLRKGAYKEATVEEWRGGRPAGAGRRRRRVRAAAAAAGEEDAGAERLRPAGRRRARRAPVRRLVRLPEAARLGTGVPDSAGVVPLRGGRLSTRYTVLSTQCGGRGWVRRNGSG